MIKLISTAQELWLNLHEDIDDTIWEDSIANPKTNIFTSSWRIAHRDTTICVEKTTLRMQHSIRIAITHDQTYINKI